jgi:hypothetical protein
MSVRTIAEKYMELCGEGKHFEFMRNYYGPEMVSVEGDGREFAGKEEVIHKSEVFQGNNDIVAQDIRGPFFNGDPGAATTARSHPRLERTTARSKAFTTPSASASSRASAAGFRVRKLRRTTARSAADISAQRLPRTSRADPEVKWRGW